MGWGIAGQWSRRTRITDADPNMPRVTIRFKLLLLSVAMLSIPYVGFQYLRETER
jgi:hypothetical protein